MWSIFSNNEAINSAYELGCKVEVGYYTDWKLHHGKKKSSDEAVSIFVFETSNWSKAKVDIIKSVVKKIKELRHPGILRYLDSVETDKDIYLVVEPVEPLDLYLSKVEKNKEETQLALSWGLYQIASAVAFLNKDCQLIHYNVHSKSIFVDQAGEWKLFGLECLTPSEDPPPIQLVLTLLGLPRKNSKSPTDVNIPSWTYDSKGLAHLIWQIFNGYCAKSTLLQNPGKIPPNLVSHYLELILDDQKSRSCSLTFLKRASEGTGFFKNKFVDTMLFLREINIKENEEKCKFFNNLSSCLDTFPQDTCVYRILPELINAFEFGNAGSSVLSPIFKLGNLLSEDDYQKKIVPCIIKMFSSKDRATRVKLLQQAEEFIGCIKPCIVNNQIFPNFAPGFMDPDPTIRNHTIMCMIYLAPKLNYQNLNVELLKHFARLQSKDEQGGIRTNAIVCLGKIASYLHPLTRKEVLINAFLQALQDPFPPARAAAISALSVTELYYSVNDCMDKILPALYRCTKNQEKSIRDKACKTIGRFMSKLKKVSDDPNLKEKIVKNYFETLEETPNDDSQLNSWHISNSCDVEQNTDPLSSILSKNEVFKNKYLTEVNDTSDNCYSWDTADSIKELESRVEQEASKIREDKCFYRLNEASQTKQIRFRKLQDN